MNIDVLNELINDGMITDYNFEFNTLELTFPNGKILRIEMFPHRLNDD